MTLRYTPISILLLLLFGCMRVPENITPVENFDIERYSGTWYEIARLDHRFERGLDNVTATYTVRDRGDIDVHNRGFNREKERWSEVTGVARWAGEPGIGHLRVSFFRPFYASYIVFALDHENYEYALVCGSSRKYLWLLARTPVMESARQQRLIEKAGAYGFATNELIFVRHD